LSNSKGKKIEKMGHAKNWKLDKGRKIGPYLHGKVL
jgi:hypothetical protein